MGIWEHMIMGKWDYGLQLDCTQILSPYINLYNMALCIFVIIHTCIYVCSCLPIIKSI